MDGRDTPGHDGVRAAGRVNRKGALYYSALLTPVRQIAIVLNLPVVTTVKGSAVLLLPTTDRYGSSAGVMQNLAGLPPRRPEIWMTGDASGSAEDGLGKLGLALTERCGKQLPLLDWTRVRAPALWARP
jgi:hypothetical protein